MPKPRDFTLPTEIVLIKDLKPHPRNYRKHPKEQLNHIVQSIKENKIYRNVVIAKDNTILAGHGVIEGLQILEATEAPCIRLDIEPDSPEALKVLAGDNEIANLANDNTFLLAELLKEVSDKTNNLIGTGYTDSTLEDLLDSLTKSSEGTEYQEPEYQGDNGYSDGDGGVYGDGDDTEPREVKEAVEDDFEQPEENEIKTDIVLGDLFEIGNHRLLCGDSTDKDSVSRLMNGEKADMVFTSPPYNQGGSGMKYDYYGELKKLYKQKTDNKTSEEYKRFLLNILIAISLVTKENAGIFWNVAYNAKSRDDYGKVIFSDENPFTVQESIVWDKTHPFPIASKGILSRRCEFVFLLSKDKYFTNQGDNEVIGNYWAINSNGSQQESHKACFPIGLPSKGIVLCSLEGEIVLEPFLGSGTTMVASHQLDRRCYGMELDPRYCQVIIERMIKLDPTLVVKKNGEPFALGIK